MNAPFQALRDGGWLPVGPDTAQPAQAAVGRLKIRFDEGSDAYPAVLATLTPKWRVIVCREGTQWILQSRRGAGAKDWRGDSYCQTREGLLRCIRERAGACDKAALAHLATLPVHIRDVRP